MNNISLIIQREFKERVYKKSFLLTTFLMPLLMVLLMAAPTLIMIYGGGEKKVISVVDESGLIAPALQSNNECEFRISDSELQDAMQQSLEDETFGVLWIGKDIVADNSKAQLYTNSASSVMLEEIISGQIEDIIEQERLKEYNISNLKEIMDKVKAKVSLQTFRNDKKDEDQGASSTAIASVIGMVLGFALYFFLVIYGSIVMQSIIEEKNSRILEVMVSTVRPFELMMGKILGVASVAITQILIWGILVVVGATVVMPMIMPEDLLGSIQSIQGGADINAMMQSSNMDIDPEMLAAMASVMDTNYIITLVIELILFFAGGFLLYASLYAAVGASVDEVQDAQQLTTIITLPIIAAFLVMMMVMKDPNSPLVTWCSIIPFTSPIVMITRIPTGIPSWEIWLSIVLLYLTFMVAVWVSGRIYKVGIFMHGSKPKLKDLVKWFRY